jgi:osomolarity two-component system sensor histidine kinase NIK1
MRTRETFSSCGHQTCLTILLQKIASSLTDQVPSILEVTKAVALGDLSKVISVSVQREMLDLKMTANFMFA